MLVKEEKPNLGRQREIDLVKAFAILFMVTIHVYEEMSAVDYSVICSAPFDVILQFLGGPLAAPVFMFSMGLGLSYSSHRSPADFFKRGLWLFVFSYIFNVLRFTLSYLVSCGFTDIDFYEAFYNTFHIDILPFAGLTFMLIALLKKLRVPVYGVCGIALVMQAVGIAISSLVDFSGLFPVYFFGLFVKTGEPSYFPLFLWFIYPALGLLFAKYLRHIEDTDALYKTVFGVSATVLCTLCASLCFIGYDIRNLFTLCDDMYYFQTFLHTVFSLACIGIELSVAHLLLKYIHLPRLGRAIAFMSSKLNNIYIVQWIIIGWVSYFYYELPAAAIIPVGILIVVVSALIVRAYLKIKGKRARAVKA